MGIACTFFYRILLIHSDLLRHSKSERYRQDSHQITSKSELIPSRNDTFITARNNKPVAEDEFKDDKADCRNEESTATNNKPVTEDEFQDNKDDFIEFFLHPLGQKLDKDYCPVAEDDCRDK
jgi:hypothetical protein